MKAIRLHASGFVLGLWAVLLLLPALAAAAELSIPPVVAMAGEIVVVPLKIDAVDNLAGAKMVLAYDPAVLTFQKAAKTAETSSLMHVVNDRQPGRLIVVMAGAVGIKGKDFALLNLSFLAGRADGLPQTTRLEIIEAQLMSDQLKEIPCTLSTAELQIIPAAVEPRAVEPPAPPAGLPSPGVSTKSTGSGGD